MKNVKQIAAITEQLQSLWNIETMLTEKMPSMIDDANDFGLKKILSFHLAETRQHRTAIQLICKQLDINLRENEIDEELQNILQEGERALSNPNGNLDIAIIKGAREIEQYEISSYSAAAEIAEAAGYKGVVGRLQLTREEERQSENKLIYLEGMLLKETAEIGQSVPQYH